MTSGSDRTAFSPGPAARPLPEGRRIWPCRTLRGCPLGSGRGRSPSSRWTGPSRAPRGQTARGWSCWPYDDRGSRRPLRRARPRWRARRVLDPPKRADRSTDLPARESLPARQRQNEAHQAREPVGPARDLHPTEVGCFLETTGICGPACADGASKGRGGTPRAATWATGRSPRPGPRGTPPGRVPPRRWLGCRAVARGRRWC